MKNGFPTVILLALVNAIAMSASPMMMLIGSIIGARLAASELWATLPIALMVIGTACGVLPAARSMARLGRKRTFYLFIALGTAAALVAGQGLALNSFPLFCLGAGLLGTANAALHQIRFAAMELVALEQGPTAASIIMCAGIVAAFLGPELALLGQHLDVVEFRGSFWLAAVCFVVAGFLLAAYQPAPMFGEHQHGKARSVSAMLSSPALMLAIASGCIAFVIMSFVMTATPIGMHMHQGHSMADTKWVIQSHIAAMFLPSLLTPWLFKAFSIRGLMLAGLFCYLATILIGLSDLSVIGFWGQLVMLGIGWNFLFIAGTALLPTTHLSGEQFKAQAINDTAVFSSQAIASLSAGWAISVLAWNQMLMLCLVPMLLMVAVMFWSRRQPI